MSPWGGGLGFLICDFIQDVSKPSSISTPRMAHGNVSRVSRVEIEQCRTCAHARVDFERRRREM